ncbi:hypothetical protein [Salipaludibacillus aurantiacus]|uniref:Histidine phosphatase superfamily (Branch 1) n=1 Tax=Salipaludibacillus aurantiacus TaxID=1601833 RepID=A0A1H9S661_9BACI|nr:hypothetical protein [Salipaludibacillus aurantiacus]SER80546.1 hypothetical protein SAMN05518684_10450 [Salipaludibacillus aurantiacus]
MITGWLGMAAVVTKEAEVLNPNVWQHIHLRGYPKLNGGELLNPHLFCPCSLNPYWFPGYSSNIPAFVNSTSYNNFSDRVCVHSFPQLLMKGSLLEILQSGGLIIYARHGEATIGEDEPDYNLMDCSTQRNLSMKGRYQASLYGMTFRHLAIPVQYPVVASPFCRTRESVELAFGKENVQVDWSLEKLFLLSAETSFKEKQAGSKVLNEVLESPPLRGCNKVIIAHSFPEGTGLGPIPNMGSVIVKPLGRGRGYGIVAKLTLPQFINLY